MNPMRTAAIPLLALAMTTSLAAADLHLVDPADAAFQVGGAARQELVDDQDGRRLRLSRPIDAPKRGYGWDNPGATVSFRSDARQLAVRLRWSEKHTSTSARNGVGLFLVDGAGRDDWRFDDGVAGVKRPVVVRDVPLPVPEAQGLHTYSVVMPYGDSVEFLGALLPEGARLQPPAAVKAKRPRWVAYGDSITQGFDASQVGATHAWRVAQARGWEVVNLGIGGRSTTPADAPLVAALKPDLVTVGIGTNDWQGGTPVAVFRTRIGAFLRDLRQAAPQARIALVTPLWVADSWTPDAATTPLAEYRAAASAVGAEAGVQVVDGLTLVDHERALFHRTAVHPLDAGFAQMAERLAAVLFPASAPATR